MGRGGGSHGGGGHSGGRSFGGRSGGGFGGIRGGGRGPGGPGFGGPGFGGPGGWGPRWGGPRRGWGRFPYFREAVSEGGGPGGCSTVYSLVVVILAIVSAIAPDLGSSRQDIEVTVSRTERTAVTGTNTYGDWYLDELGYIDHDTDLTDG